MGAGGPHVTRIQPQGTQPGEMLAPRQRFHSLVVEPVAGGRAGALTADDPQEDADVLDQRRLVHLGTGEAREARALSLDDRLDAVALRRGDRTLRELEDARHEGATPTWTLRKRPGAAPWLTCACWPGCPLPQFVSP